MRPSIVVIAAGAAACLCLLLASNLRATDEERAGTEKVVTRAVRPIMDGFGIPGMAVGIVFDGQSHVFNYGVASRETGQPIGDDTIFEVGSVSKTFTATLAAYARRGGFLSLSDAVSKHVPALRGSAFDRISLLQLGTHTSGGLPLQVPDEVTTDDRLFRYLHDWKPAHDPGTFRTYSNVSIGLLGRIAAASMHADFTALMEGKLFPAFGLAHTYFVVPATQNDHYAQGYTDKDAPVRLTPGVLGAEAYGVRTTAADLLRFVAANLRPSDPDDPWQQAAIDTHTGYYRVGPMTQDLIWEQYREPAALPELLAGNSTKMILETNPATALEPALAPQADVLINKTGSTNGFSTYVAFIPARKTGVILLANKRYPIEARVKLAHEILTRLSLEHLQ